MKGVTNRVEGLSGLVTAMKLVFIGEEEEE